MKEEVDLTKHSFSDALKVCQKRRIEFQPHKRRQSSLDLNNYCTNMISLEQSDDAHLDALTIAMPTIPSNRQMKPSGSALPNPGTPASSLRQDQTNSSSSSSSHRENRSSSSSSGGGGWSSGRQLVQQPPPPPAPVGVLGKMGKSLPSKWEDADRWIRSPVAKDGSINNNQQMIITTTTQQQQPLRRPRSKSGPMAVIGQVPASASSSPAVHHQPVLSRSGRPSVTGEMDSVSSCEEGMMMMINGKLLQTTTSDSSSLGVGMGGIVRSVTVHGWSDLVMRELESPSDGSPKVCLEMRLQGMKDAATMISPVVSKRDMATQMSPEGSNLAVRSPPRESNFLSLSPSPDSNGHPTSVHSFMELTRIKQYLPRLEIRDVQVDNSTPVLNTTRSKNLAERISLDLGEWKKKEVNSRASECYRREEAKIRAWENLQKAKADADIRKLEMKLEKIRSSSMEKIMIKLRSAQKKAEQMRRSVSTMKHTSNHQQQVVNKASEYKAATFRRRGHIGSLSGCFSCQASA